MKRIKKEKGITLVALIITIIVLLILATVAITSMQESNIIGYTNNAATKYNGTVTNESGTLGEYENFLGNHSGGSVGSDTTAPTVTISNVSEGVSSLSLSITLSNVSEEDYPITIEYYEKLTSASDDAYGDPVNTTTLTTGTTDSYTYRSLSSGSSYDLLVKVIDKSGNDDTAEQTAGTSCFVAGTQVLTETGMKNIEDIKVGEKVYAINLDNNARELKEVINVFSGYTDETYELTIGDEVVITTPKHQFYVVDKGWIRAHELEEGDRIVSTGEEDLVITNIEHKFHEEPLPVYNLTVEGYHNYLITKYELLVHNTGSPTF